MGALIRHFLEVGCKESGVGCRRLFHGDATENLNRMSHMTVRFVGGSQSVFLFNPD